jgi:membrane AbrB-like protein
MLKRLGAVALTLGIALAGGGLFALAGLPAAWLAGAMTAVAGTALATRLPVQVPGPLRALAFVLIGLSMGAGVTPETVQLMRTWPLSMVLLFASVVTVIQICTFYLERVHRWDRSTARFGSIPGALSAVLAMAAESRADVPHVALAQSIRLVVLVMVMPWLLTLVPDSASSQPLAAGAPETAEGGLLLLGAGLVGAWIFHRLRLPGGMLVGAMLASALLHGTGMAHGRFPAGLLAVGFIVTGALIGSRFRGVSLGVLRATLAPALGSVAIGMALTALYSWAGAVWLGLPFGQLWLAYAPGGVEAMTIVAFTMGFDAAFIGTHHVVRFIGISLFSPWWHPERGKKSS